MTKYFSQSTTTDPNQIQNLAPRPQGIRSPAQPVRESISLVIKNKELIKTIISNAKKDGEVDCPFWTRMFLTQNIKLGSTIKGGDEK